MTRRFLATSFDAAYLMPGILAGHSALKHSPDDVQLAILGVGLSDGQQEVVESILPRQRTLFLDTADLTADMPKWSHISNAAWVRLGLASLLPAGAERVVYVDADTFTREDLGPLFDIDLSRHVIAACLERPMPLHRFRHRWGQRVRPDLDYLADCPVPDVYGYFNSGLMVIDLPSWRDRKVEQNGMRLVENLPESYLLLDQDVLNTVLYDQWQIIDWRRWNWPGYLKDSEAWNARLVHFVSTPKPWASQPLGAPFNREYLAAARDIGWDLDWKPTRIKSGLIETFAPYSLVVRRKKIARAVRSSQQSTTVPDSQPSRNGKALVVAFDDNYLLPGLVAAKTALDHSPSTVNLIILGVNLSGVSIDRIAAHLPRHRYQIADASHLTRGLPKTMPTAAWARIVLGPLIPDTVERVVYVDADTFSRRDLSRLFDMSLEGRVLAACIEEPDPTHHGRHAWGLQAEPDHHYSSDCPAPEVAAYFNSGVLVVDMRRWREDDVEKRLINAAQSIPDSYTLPDQDLLNSVLWKEWLPLDWREWNWPGLKLDRMAWESRIVHYKGPTKPWAEEPLGSPFSREYKEAAASIGWDIKPRRYRIKSGLLEMLLPYSIVIRRPRIGRAVRGRISWRKR